MGSVSTKSKSKFNLFLVGQFWLCLDLLIWLVIVKSARDAILYLYLNIKVFIMGLLDTVVVLLHLYPIYPTPYSISLEKITDKI